MLIKNYNVEFNLLLDVGFCRCFCVMIVKYFDMVLKRIYVYFLVIGCGGNNLRRVVWRFNREEKGFYKFFLFKRFIEKRGVYMRKVFGL